MAAVLSSKFIGIMVFYIILSYLIGPLVGYYFLGKTTQSAGTGFVIGSILSIILWYSYGSKMV